MKNKLLTLLCCSAFYAIMFAYPNVAKADDANAQSISNSFNQHQVNNDQPFKLQLDPNAINNDISTNDDSVNNESKYANKLKVSDLKTKHTKKLKYHKRSVEKVLKTLTRYQ